MKVDSKFEIKLSLKDTFWILFVFIVLLVIGGFLTYSYTISKVEIYCDNPTNFEFNHIYSNVREFQIQSVCYVKSLFKDEVIENKTIQIKLIQSNQTRTQVEFY